jgi:hypothetical protein
MQQGGLVQGIKHPLTGEVYEVEVVDGADVVVVTDAEGRSGTFTMDGRWLHGDVRVADAHLCGWLASARATSRFAPADAPGGSS